MTQRDDVSGEIRLITDPPDLDIVAVGTLLESVGMGNRDPEKMARAVTASTQVVVAYLDLTLVGFGRSISDGEYYCTLWDVAVDSRFQNRGIGTKIINILLLGARCPGMRMIGLFTGLHNDAFYARFGFSVLHGIHPMTIDRSTHDE